MSYYPYAYAIPRQLIPRTRPAIVAWARAFAGVVALVNLFTAITSAFMLVVAVSQPHSMHDPAVAIRSFVIMGFLGTALTIAGTKAFFRANERTPATYTTFLVLMAGTTVSCFCLPAALPLLFLWLKPEVKAWFGA